MGAAELEETTWKITINERQTNLRYDTNKQKI